MSSPCDPDVNLEAAIIILLHPTLLLGCVRSSGSPLPTDTHTHRTTPTCVLVRLRCEGGRNPGDDRVLGVDTLQPLRDYKGGGHHQHPTQQVSKSDEAEGGRTLEGFGPVWSSGSGGAAVTIVTKYYSLWSVRRLVTRCLNIVFRLRQTSTS